MKKEILEEQMDELRRKMGIIEWDRKHNLSFAKEHLYDELKKKYNKLKKSLQKTDSYKK